MWRIFAAVPVCHMAFDDPSFCCWDAMDYSLCFQRPNYICDNVLLFERLGLSVDYSMVNQTDPSAFSRSIFNSL